MTKGKELNKIENTLTMSERFQNKVMQEFGGNIAGELRMTGYQRQLVQGYFIVIDKTLRTAEEERIRKNESNKERRYDNSLPFTWTNVNLDGLSLDAVHYAQLGLDMMEANHLFPIPYKNSKKNKYDMTLMPGYNGIKYIAENYALNKPKDVRIELVHKNDHFKILKKNKGVDIESYEFEIVDPFDRGDIIGGFGYIEYDDPHKNEVVPMSKKDMDKRKPKYASASFWGGQGKEYKNGKMVDVEKEGWKEEMYTKTLMREVFSAKHIPRDPKKVDDAYQYMHQQELRLSAIADTVQQTIDVEANSIPFEDAVKREEPMPAINHADTAKCTAEKEAENKARVAYDSAKSHEITESPDDEIDKIGDDVFKNKGLNF
ncbi:MAG: recombinase RecT [Bacteroidaceae bacterium]|nr:recombinase RecT [Bacteroidaceae bacterium]